MSARRKLEQKGHITTEKQVELEQAKQMIMSGQSDLQILRLIISLLSKKGVTVYVRIFR